MAGLVGLPPLPNPAAGIPYLDDLLKKDKKQSVKMSQVLKETGWGAPTSALNKEARATIMAESGGSADVYNGICCYGWFQINIDAHLGKHGSPKERDAWIKWIKNPYNNSRVAKEIWKDAGNTFCAGNGNPWEANCNGRFKQYMPNPPDPDVRVTDKGTLIGDAVDSATGAVSDAAGAVLGPLDEIASALLSASTWFRVGKGALGGVLVVLGTGAIVFVVANKAGANPVAKAVKAVT